MKGNKISRRKTLELLQITGAISLVGVAAADNGSSSDKKKKFDP